MHPNASNGPSSPGAHYTYPQPPYPAGGPPPGASYSYPAGMAYPPPPPIPFGRIEDIVVAVCALLGFIAFHFVRVRGGFGLLLFAVVYLLTATFYLVKKGVKIRKGSYVIALLYLLSAAGAGIASIPAINFFNLVFHLLLGLYFVYYTTRMSLDGDLSDLSFMDGMKMVFLAPFGNYNAAWHVAAKRPKKRSVSKNILYACLGLLLTLPLTLIIIGILSGIDEGFAQLWDQISRHALTEILFAALHFMLGLFLAAYLFGALYSNVTKRKYANYTGEQARESLKRCRFMPQAVGIAAVVPLLFVYLIYVLAQLPHMSSVLWSQLPRDYTYAQYAKQGFGELCVIALINLMVILLLHLLAKRNEKGNVPVVTRVMTYILALFTLLLMASAAARLWMYIEVYGLTRLRLYCAWFLIALVAVFLLLCVRLLFTRFPLVKVAVPLLSVWFLVLVFSNSDRLIVDHNVRRYLNGEIPTAGTEMVEDLSFGSLEGYLPLLSADEDVYAGLNKQRLHAALAYRCSIYAGEAQLRYLTVTDTLAEARIKQAVGYQPPAGYPGIRY